MNAFFKKILTIAIICAIGYFILAYHYIVIDKKVRMLKKSELTLKYTIYSTKAKEIKNIVTIPELWFDGIGELLLEENKISEEEYEKYRIMMEEEEEY
ncbi:MAG: hypothetical protein JXL81_09655 [Deltaproteobacteria bacterium]|nr:hypothetical protein [Deltaproteobacteria bacterium]